MASTLVTTASSTAYIEGAGPVVIFESSAGGTTAELTDVALWYKVHPRVRQLSFGAKILSTDTDGATIIQAAFEIQASMDGQNRVNTLLGTITCTGVVGIGSTLGNGVADGLAVDAHWPYVRAVFSSGTTLSSGITHQVAVASYLN